MRVDLEIKNHKGLYEPIYINYTLNDLLSEINNLISRNSNDFRVMQSNSINKKILQYHKF